MYSCTFYAVFRDGVMVDGPLGNPPGKLEIKKVRMTNTYETVACEDGVNEHGHAVIRERLKLVSTYEVE